MDDVQLIQAFIGGNVRAFNTLVIRWQPRIHNFAYRFFADSDDAVEITQKTFIKAYQKLGTLKDERKFGTWLYRIANNLCMDELRHNNLRQTMPLEALKTAPQVDTVASADARLERQEAVVLLHRALLQLPPEQRIVVIMKQYEDFTFKEIAEILEEPENTVKSRMYYGLQALRKTFETWNIKKEIFDYD